MAMVSGYIGDPTTYFYKTQNDQSRFYTMIFGEEVQYVPSNADRVQVKNRSRDGYVKKDAIMNSPVLEVYFIDVKQGDSCFIVTPGRKKILIDGGVNNQALRFLSWKYRLQDFQPGDKLYIDYMIVSHADDDHIKGLKLMLQDARFSVGKILHNGIARYKDGIYGTKLGDRSADGKYLVTRYNQLSGLIDNELSTDFLEWKNVVNAQGNVQYNAVQAYQSIQIEPDVKLEVLGPVLGGASGNQGPYLPWFSSEGETINGNSVLLKLTYKQFSFLFPGDINEMGSEHVMDDQVVKPKLVSHVFKAPHHGSHHYFEPFLQQVNPLITVVSSGDENSFGHPRSNFLGSVGRASRNRSLIFATQIAGMFKDTDESLREKLDLSPAEWNNLDSKSIEKLRKQFKRRLHGMINVRTDGERLFAARRIKTSHGWEYYGNIKP